MPYQSSESCIELNTTKPFRVLIGGKPQIVKCVCIRNPYQLDVMEEDGVCYVFIGHYKFPVKETMSEICEKFKIFKEEFNKEFDEWYNSLPVDPELRRLATGGMI